MEVMELIPVLATITDLIEGASTKVSFEMINE